MNRIFLTIFILIKSFFLYGQFTISGKITNVENKPLEFSTVRLIKDTSVLFTTLSDSSGYFKLKSVHQDYYTVSISCMNYNSVEYFFNLTKDTIINSKLMLNENKLKDVVISSNQPVFERKSDKFIFNIGNLKGGKGLNAWDILTQTPLVTTSEQGNISISGTQGARILINNRKILFAGEALVNYLRGISSESVLQIEVITVPSSKYESEGGGGIINIVLKKNKSNGIKGEINFSNKKATYNSQTINSSLNYRKDNLNLFANVSFSNQNQIFTGEYLLDYLKDSKVYYTNNNYIKRNLKNKLDIVPTIGIDLNISKKATIGILVDYSNSSLNRYNTTNTSFINSSNLLIDSLYKTVSMNNEKTNYVNINLNYYKSIDTVGGTLNISFDHLGYNENRQTIQNTNVVDLNGNLGVSRDYFTSVLPQKIINNAFLIDFSKPIKKKVTIEMGMRYAQSNTDNDVNFQILLNNQLVNDTGRSNYFKYFETIFAGYGLVKHRINDKLDYQIGIRIENTQTKGELINKHQTTTNEYTNYFPTVFLNYTPNRNHQFSFTYTERINRPSFWDINPFRYYTSKNIYKTGNPFLIPSKIFKKELTYSYKNKWIFQLIHSKAINAFASLTYSDSLETYDKQINYGTREVIALNISYSDRIKPFWFFRATANYSNVKFKGQYEYTLINQSSSYPNLTMLNGLTLSKDKKIYTTITISNFFEHYSENVLVGNQFVANISFTKISKNNNLQFGLSISDVFRSSVDNYFIKQSYQNITQQYYYDSKGISLSVKYGFGSSSIRKIRERSKSNKEEKERIN